MSKISPRMRGISQMRTGIMYTRATSGRAENTYDAGACGADIYAVSARAAYGPPEPNREKIRTAYARAENHGTRAATLNLPREAPKCDLMALADLPEKNFPDRTADSTKPGGLDGSPAPIYEEPAPKALPKA